MKKQLGTILLILILVTGLSLFLYPTVSNLQHQRGSTQAIQQYADSVSQWENRDRDEAWNSAVAYNQVLYRDSFSDDPTEVSASDYDAMLNVSGNGMMGYIDIPRIHCRLPVYHGIQAATLESYVGHLPSSSLPVGGENTHCVITGHTGMPSARLLTDLNKLSEGDVFTVTTLDQTLTYEVDRILIVLPDETDALRIEEGEDLCTLVTCTPYGVNTHRLLVRGHRVAASPEEPSAESDSFVEWLAVNPMMIVLAAVLLLLTVTFAVTRKQKEQRR